MDIFQAISHFNLTGEIDDALVPGFDQKGEWYGIYNPQTNQPVRFEAGDPIRKATIPKERVVSIDPITQEITLLGSLTTPNLDETQIFDYHHIHGNVEIIYATHVKFPNLKTIGKHLQVEYAWTLLVPKLESVGKSIDASQVRLLNLPRLKSVGNDLNACQSVEFYAPELLRVKTLATGNATIIAPKMNVEVRWTGNPEILKKWAAHKAAADKAIRRMKTSPELEI